MRRPRRRAWKWTRRFCLTILLLLVISTVYVGQYWFGWKRQQAALAQIQGKWAFTYITIGPEWLQRVSGRWKYILVRADSAMAINRPLQHVAQDIPALARLSNLHDIDLTFTDLDDRAAIELSKLPQVKRLHLSCSDFLGKEGLAAIGQMRTLEHLELDTSAVSGDQLPGLAKLVHLQSLNLQSNPLDEHSLLPLAGLIHLQKLNLAVTGIGDDDMRALVAMSELTELDLSFDMISDHAIAALRGLPKLQTLNVGGTSLTDAAIDDLLQLSALKNLDVRDTKITAAGLRRLAHARPGLHVLRGEWGYPVEGTIE